MAEQKKIEILENTLLKLLVRRGTDLDRQQISLSEGELGYTVDSKRLFVGDNSPGGILTGNKFLGTVSDIEDLNSSAYPGDAGFAGNTLYIRTDSNSWSPVASYNSTSNEIDITVEAGDFSPTAAGESLEIDGNGKMALKDTISIDYINLRDPNNYLSMPDTLRIGNVTYNFPTGGGANNYVLTTDGGGNLSWKQSQNSQSFLFNTENGPMPVGAITAFASATNLPSGWLLCDGSSYSTSTYSELFDIIGYNYGGTGSSFVVPNYINSTLHGDLDPSTGTLYNVATATDVGTEGVELTVIPATEVSTIANSQNATWQTKNALTILDITEVPEYILVEQRWFASQSPGSQSAFRTSDGREVFGNTIDVGATADQDQNTIQLIVPLNNDGTFEYYANATGSLSLADASFRPIGYYTKSSAYSGAPGPSVLESAPTVYAIKADPDVVLTPTLTVNSPLTASLDGTNVTNTSFNPLEGDVEIGTVQQDVPVPPGIEVFDTAGTDTFITKTQYTKFYVTGSGATGGNTNGGSAATVIGYLDLPVGTVVDVDVAAGIPATKNLPGNLSRVSVNSTILARSDGAIYVGNVGISNMPYSTDLDPNGGIVDTGDSRVISGTIIRGGRGGVDTNGDGTEEAEGCASYWGSCPAPGAGAGGSNNKTYSGTGDGIIMFEWT